MRLIVLLIASSDNVSESLSDIMSLTLCEKLEFAFRVFSLSILRRCFILDDRVPAERV